MFTLLPWVSLGVLELKSGKLWLCDARMGPNEQAEIIDFAPGEYEVCTQNVVFEDVDERTARLRVVPVGSSGEVGVPFCTTWADAASQGVCDDVDFWGNAGRGWRETYDEPLWADGNQIITLPGGQKLFICSSGDGDGVFNVLEITENGKRIGLQVEFYGEGEVEARQTAPEPYVAKPNWGERIVIGFVILLATYVVASIIGHFFGYTF